MKRGASVPFLVLLAAAAPALPAAAGVAEVVVGAAGATTVPAPGTFPINFGPKPLGGIGTLGSTLCFRQPTSPPGSCDAPGTVRLQAGLKPPFYLGGAFRENLATGVKTPANFPVSLPAGQRLVVVSQWVAARLGTASGELVLRTTSGGATNDFVLNHVGAGTPPGPCVQSAEALCLNGNRFKVQSHFLTSDAQTGAAKGVRLTGDTGYFWFFNPSNVEAVAKVLNACGLNNRYWVFGGGLTDVRTVTSVTDTARLEVKTYVNPQGTPYQPVQDTQAFATCP
jgi:hypothetical protein